MKKTILIICASMILPLLCSAGHTPLNEPAAAEPGIEFADNEHNFGKVAENGKKVTYDYVFTNTGDCPLVVTRIITSCRCISTSYTKKPIPPGGQGMVTVTYDPKKQQGVFHKAIQVHSNAPEGMHIIIAKGEVVVTD